MLVEYSLQKKIFVDSSNLDKINRKDLTRSQFEALRKLEGRSFEHNWEFEEALSKISSDWLLKGGIKNNRSIILPFFLRK